MYLNGFRLYYALNGRFAKVHGKALAVLETSYFENVKSLFDQVEEKLEYGTVYKGVNFETYLELS